MRESDAKTVLVTSLVSTIFGIIPAPGLFRQPPTDARIP
jgi:hypothetical protein